MPLVGKEMHLEKNLASLRWKVRRKETSLTSRMVEQRARLMECLKEKSWAALTGHLIEKSWALLMDDQKERYLASMMGDQKVMLMECLKEKSLVSMTGHLKDMKMDPLKEKNSASGTDDQKERS